MNEAEKTKPTGVSLDVIHRHAAGIDIGNAAHYVAVPPDRDPEPVRRFECFTQDLHALADWLLPLPDSHGSHAIDRSLLAAGV